MKISPGPRLLLPATTLLTAAACLITTLTVIPAQARTDAKEQGAAVFASSGCAHCHGDSGQGTSKGPSLQDVRKKMNSDAVAKQIKDGGRSMPPFGDSLSDPQIEQLVKFLRSRHPKYQPATPALAH
jgi:mono/diheme cytochrome c family protein